MVLIVQMRNLRPREVKQLAHRTPLLGFLSSCCSPGPGLSEFEPGNWSKSIKVEDMMGLETKGTWLESVSLFHEPAVENSCWAGPLSWYLVVPGHGMGLHGAGQRQHGQGFDP